MEEPLFDKELGEITLIRNPRARHLIARVREGHLQITLPLSSSRSDLPGFIERMRPRLKALLEKSAHSRHHFMPETGIHVEGFDMRFQEAPVKGLKAQWKDPFLTILYAQTTDFHDESVQNLICKLVEQGLRLAASVYLRRRLECLSLEYHLPYSSFRATVTRSVWGSCSRDNVIALSGYLMLLPGHLQDFVILHELTHTIHKNHGPEFHGFLSGLLQGREKALKAELRLYRTGF